MMAEWTSIRRNSSFVGFELEICSIMLHETIALLGSNLHSFVCLCSYLRE